MRKFFVLSLMTVLLCSTPAFSAIQPIAESQAFESYKKRIKTDLSQLIYLLDRFNIPEMEIKIDGNTYQSKSAFPFAKAFLAVYYRKEKAEDWIRKYCYRSPFTNQVMLGCMKGEKCIPGRDLLLNELKALRKVEQEINAKR